MSNTSYLIKLKPIGKYFFGGERTFGHDNVNYLVRSCYFPQQTALLGLLRYKLLDEHDCLSPKKRGKISEAENLIGPHSFQHQPERNNYGKIEAISHLFLLKNGQKRFEMASRDRCILNLFDDAEDDRTVCFDLKYQNGMPLLSGFEPKDYETNNITDGQILIPLENDKTDETGRPVYDAPFIEHHQVGILKRQNNHPDNEKGFYKQYFYELREGYEFAFMAQLKEDILKTGTSIVPFGGERSRFKMTIEKAAMPTEVQFDNNSDYDKVILLSDAYVNSDIYKECLFAITETQDFRCIESSLAETMDYHNIPKNKNTAMLNKSVKLNLLKKGSIFYCKKGESASLEKSLKSEEAFRQIGYNQFIKS